MQQKRSLPPTVHLMAGAVSGLITSVTLQPFDVVKTRLQQTPNSQRLRLIPCVTGIVKNEGVYALWKATVPSIYRTVPGVGLYFVTLNTFKSLVLGSSFHTQRGGHNTLSPGESLLVAFFARAFAATALMPVTVVKTRMESGLFNYPNTWAALSTIARTEGVRGLMAGLGPTIMRDAPFSALYYAFYEQAKTLSQGVQGNALTGVPTPFLTFMCGGIAGTLATALTHPPDVLRTRMQLAGPGAPRAWPSMKAIFRTQGISGFYRGMIPRMVRRTLTSALTWTVYEEIVAVCLGLRDTVGVPNPMH